MNGTSRLEERRKSTLHHAKSAVGTSIVLQSCRNRGSCSIRFCARRLLLLFVLLLLFSAQGLQQICCFLIAAIGMACYELSRELWGQFCYRGWCVRFFIAVGIEVHGLITPFHFQYRANVEFLLEGSCEKFPVLHGPM